MQIEFSGPTSSPLPTAPETPASPENDNRPASTPARRSTSSGSDRIALRPSASKALEDLFIGAVLPVVGLFIPQTDRSGTAALREEEDEPGGVVEEGIVIEENVNEKEVLAEPKFYRRRPCCRIPIQFQDICTDVKVQKVYEQKESNCFNGMLSRFGFGRGGDMVEKRILHNLDGTIEPGRFVACMGGSGAGKSTLLNVLSQRILPSSGVVRYGDVPVTDTIVRSCSVFVQQLDMFLGNLNVHEHLQCQIRLRLPELKTAQERDECEETVCNHLSLAKCRYNQIGMESGVGGISGGERKRLNVASELLTSPTVVFADEPTTGLDSFMAASIVNVLKELADSGHTVVATIHQPSSKIFEMFDDVLLLAEGRLIYFGERLGVIEWFRRLNFTCPPFTNPADFIIKLVSLPEEQEARLEKISEIISWSEKWRISGPEFLEAWKEKRRKKNLASAKSRLHARIYGAIARDTQSNALLGEVAAQIPTETANEAPTPEVKKESNESEAIKASSFTIKERQRISWWHQVSILYRRAVQANRKDKLLVHARAIQTIILSLLYGFLMFRLTWSVSDARTKMSGCFTLVMNQSMVGATSVIHTFIVEKPVIQREYESGWISPTAYIAAKMLADAPIQIVFPGLFCIITYWMMRLNDDVIRFFISLGIVLIVSNTAMSIGYFASAVAPNGEIAHIITNLTILPLILFGGFFAKLEDTPVWLSWIQYISFVKYGFSNTLVTIFRNETVYSETHGALDGIAFLSGMLGINYINYVFYFFMLFVLLAFYRATSLIGFALLVRRTKENA